MGKFLDATDPTLWCSARGAGWRCGKLSTRTIHGERFCDTCKYEPFPPGGRVYVDGMDLAIVKQAFPEGSSSYLFPHYKVDIIDGDKNVAVHMSRVGVDKKEKP